MIHKITKLALASRLIVLVTQVLANLALPDHKPDVFRAATTQNNTLLLDNIVNYLLGGLRHWDGEYFLHISEHLYSYENTLAFYPFYPVAVRHIASVLYFGKPTSLNFNLLVAAMLNLFVFCKAANILYTLTLRTFNDLNKSWNAALLFCFNPAAIFFSAAYSETMFAALSFYMMLECVSELRFNQTTLSLAASLICRSNGLVNMGFPLYFHLRRMLLSPCRRSYRMLKLILSLVVAMLPLTCFYFYVFQIFCSHRYYEKIEHTDEVRNYAVEKNYVLAGHRQPQDSPWCNQTLPYPYSYIQSHYWQVGFLRYYEWKQLPNFLLAMPILGFLYYHCFLYLKHFIVSLLPKYTLHHMLKEFKSFPFVLHALFLTSFCTFFVHIQVSTRLLCSATPCLYWFAADHMPKSFAQLKLRSKAGLILLWFGIYYFVGTVMFSNNLPWT